MAAITPNKSCQNVLDVLKASNLNFLIQESPYSAYITIRKRFVKDFSSANLAVAPKPLTESELLSKMKSLESENDVLEKDLEISEANAEKVKHESEILQNRLANAEAEIFKNCKHSKTRDEQLSNEIKSLKLANSRLTAELTETKSKLSLANKTIKKEEKQMYNHEQRIENFQNTIAKLKAEKTELKSDKSKLEKKIRQQEKKTSTLVLTTSTSTLEASSVGSSNSSQNLFNNNKPPILTTLEIPIFQTFSTSQVKSSPTSKAESSPNSHDKASSTLTNNFGNRAKPLSVAETSPLCKVPTSATEPQSLSCTPPGCPQCNNTQKTTEEIIML